MLRTAASRRLPLPSHPRQDPQHLRFTLYTTTGEPANSTHYTTHRGANTRLTAIHHYGAHAEHHTILHLCQTLRIAALDYVRAATGAGGQNARQSKGKAYIQNFQHFNLQILAKLLQTL